MSSFARQEFCEKNLPEGTNHLAPAEQLEVACWNGLLNDLLPEIMNQSSCTDKIYLWQVEARTSHLKLSMGSCDPEFEKEFTIDPSMFLKEKKMN
jgi:hypothetical protein